jgi:hypothetical protein
MPVRYASGDKLTRTQLVRKLPRYKGRLNWGLANKIEKARLSRLGARHRARRALERRMPGR